MALDPRIALQGASFQAPNILGAMRQGQEYRQNQMAMQAAQDTAARAAAAREAARSVNFMDPTAGASFLSAYGADVAEPYLAAGARAAGTDVAQATGRRAQTTQDREGLDRIRGAWGRGLVSALADSSDTGLMTLRGRLIADGVPEAEVDETLAQLGAVDAAARPSFIRNLASTSEDARKAMEFVAPKPERINRGGSIVTVDMNPNSASYGQEIRVDTVTPSPNRPVIVQTAEGFGSVVPGQPGFTPVTDAEGSPVMPYQAPRTGAAGTDDARAGAAEGLRSTLDSLRGYYAALDESGGIVSSGGVRQPDGTISAGRGGGENLVASAGASLPGRVLGRTFGSRDQTQRDNIQTAIPMIVASLKDLTGMSAQQMNSNVELQLFLGTVGDPSRSIETVNEALARFERYVDRVAGAQGGGAATADPLEGRTAVGPGGQRLVRSGGQWVPQ